MRLSVWVASAALLGASLVARADTFDLTATLDQGGSLSGTVQINTQTGVITDEDITFTDEDITFANGSNVDLFSGAPHQVLGDNYIETRIDDLETIASLNLYIPVTSLIGYTGGAICSLRSSCPGSYILDPVPGAGVFEITSGELTDISLPPTAETPEPSSILMLGTGLLGIAGALRKRLA